MYDIIFISYNEPNADENFAKLKARFPLAKRVHGVQGIHQAHIAAAKKAFTPMFWVVDGDADILDTFKFDHKVSEWDLDVVHVWKSQNPVNGMTYGYGGVKLLPRKLTLNMDTSSLDMTLAISDKFKAMEEISNITAFNTDPFSSWRSAFRECCKLAQNTDTDSSVRVIGWKTSDDEYAKEGALAGQKYGQENASNKEALLKINDFNWLKEQFESYYPPLEK